MARLLVIEDEPNFRHLLCEMLRSGGHETIEAEDGLGGVALVRRERPDLVITDIIMPGQEGIETIQQIREIDEALPIIAISGMSGLGDFAPLEDAMLMGAAVALVKPIERSTILSEVKKLLTSV